ncbi:MAG: hypothetical protein HUU50_13320 [Candidatus Brocadiae bacterium]|nr:hypothetical protein [Candidatus Brocadiia bacterium]
MEQKKNNKGTAVKQENITWLDEQDENYKDLAVKIVDKLKQIRYSYPGVSDSLEELQGELKDSMETIHRSLLELPDQHKDLLTLLVISEIHKTVDEVFKTPNE